MTVDIHPAPDIEAEAQRQKTALLYRNSGVAQAVTVVNASLLAYVNGSLQAMPRAALAWRPARTRPLPRSGGGATSSPRR